jgi:hypothetical protein
MVAPVHKNTNALLILTVVVLFLYAGKTHNRRFLCFFFEATSTFVTAKLPFAAQRTI